MYCDAVYRYQELEAACNRCQILEGGHLDSALCTWSQYADESVTEAAVMQLQRRLQQCNERRDKLKSTHEMLNVHQMALVDQIARLSDVSAASKTDLQRTVEQVQLDNANVSQTI